MGAVAVRYTAGMRQVQVRGCLPAILMLVVVGALVALVVSASLAVVLPVAGVLLVLGLARSLWYRLTGRTPPAPLRAATFRSFRIDPGWTEAERPGPASDDGPVVDALPRRPRPDAESTIVEPGRLPAPPGPDRPTR
jgi:hypothetical protein